MAQKGIREFDAKRIMARGLSEFSNGAFSFEPRQVLISPETDFKIIEKENPWLNVTKLVVKPDQLFGKRGKNNLLLVNKTWKEVQNWISEYMNKPITITQTTGLTTGILTHFLIEQFVAHDKEYYFAITSHRDYDTFHFSTQGGIDIESAWDSVTEVNIPVLSNIDEIGIEGFFPKEINNNKQALADFFKSLYKMFINYHFVYLELNPFTIVNNKIIPLDTVAKVDDYASFQCAEKWGNLEFPAPFGLNKSNAEKRIDELDERTGASLKLTVLNPEGRIWNLVAGGGASVIYADTVVDLGFTDELANYGEYSGDPSTELTYEYTRTILDLMTQKKDKEGRPKFLIIGGGIANFTDVAKTFSGIIQAITEYADNLKNTNVKIYVRRGGPNYKEGLELMRKLGKCIGLPIEVFGPETHMTRIVSMALTEKET